MWLSRLFRLFLWQKLLCFVGLGLNVAVWALLHFPRMFVVNAIAVINTLR